MLARVRGQLLIAGTLLLSGAGAASARPSLDEERLGRLDRYDVLTFVDPAGSGINKSKAIGVFDATPDEIYRTATDYEHLAEFAPRLSTSRVVDRRGDAQAFVMLTAQLPWPVSSAWVYAEFDHEKLGGGVYRIRFWQIRGSMRRYSGSMLIEPWSGRKSAVTYELLVEPDSRAPRGLINSKLKDAAGRYVHALRQRINDLHRLGRLHPQLPPNPNLPSELAGPSEEPVVVEQVARAGASPSPAAR
jgi:hypothetical protein